MRTTLAIAALLGACNTPPAALQVSITPGDPTTSDDLVAAVDGAFTDPDGDEVSYSFTWYADDVAQDHLTSLSIPARETSKHQVWKLFVQPTDGKLEGPPSEASVTILNTPPTAELSVSPEIPLTTDDVVATVSFEDSDGDEVDLDVLWYVDGEPSSYEDETLPAEATARGEVWTVEVIPSDDDEPGEPVSASVNIDNTAPEMLSVTLSPTDPREGDEILATVQGQDDDGDHITYRYAWIVDGEQVIDDEIDAITGEWFDKHQQVIVTVTPHDGYIVGESMSSEAVTVLNSVPSISDVTLEPSEIYEATEVTCTPSGWSDDDGDEEGYTISWVVNSVEVSTDATLTGDHFDRGENVFCTATPYDGEASGETATSDVSTVLNTPPVIASATLSSTSPVEGDTLTVAVSGSDDDGDTVSITTAWFVDGVQVSTEDSLSSGLFDRDQSVLAELTPNDGTDDGATVTTATAIVQNSPPEIISLLLSPSSLYTDDTLSASIATTDADGDTVTLNYAWSVDGSAISETGSSLDGATWFDKHQTVALVVTPADDADTGSPSSASVTVLNSLPSAPSLSIEPAEPMEGLDDLLCSVTADSTDDDADSVTYGFSWTVDGSTYTGATTTTETGDTIPADATSEAELWRCTVTPDDGDDAGSSASVEVEILPPCDADHDGYESPDCGGTDCDDRDASANPGETEACIDGVDNDCDGVVDNCSLAGADLILTGSASGDEAGQYIDLTPDLTGDGYADILVGATYNDDAGTDYGAAYIVSGVTSGTLDLAGATAVITGDGSYASAGYGVGDTGDLNGDGFTDLLVATFGPSSGPGALYVVHGPVTGDLGLSSAQGVYAGVGTYSRPNHLPGSAGDINGDGKDDILVGAHGYDRGRAYIVYGPATATTTMSTASATLYDSTSSDVGNAVGWVDDLNGDGFDEVLVGAPQDATNGARAGAAYLVFGPITGSFDLTNSDAILLGEDEYDRAGQKVSSGDVNSDGLGDVVITARDEDSAGVDAGAVYVVHGSISGTIELSTAQAKIVGRAGDEIIAANDLVSDMDGDGLPEILLGGRYADEGGLSDSGAAYLISGPITGSMSTADASMTLAGVASDDLAGWSVSTGIDLDSDGLDDFLIGAHGNDDGGTDAGAAYLFLGM